MKIAILDSNTLGEGITLKPIEEVGDCAIYPSTSADEVAERIADSHIVIVNKVRLDQSNLKDAKSLRLICLFATGYDNVDVDYCQKRGIAVCNVEGYSSHSVSQVTVAMVLSLACHLREYADFVRDGIYSKSGVANRLTPAYTELCGKTWGIVGYGNIGRQVADVARALGCRILVHRRSNSEDSNVVDIDILCKESDIITLHTPLNESTYHLIDEARLKMMKKSAIIVNTARGLVTDEAAVARAIKEGHIAAFGTDVYSIEPLPEDNPLYEIKDYPNVLLTPHMAWGALESRQRCIDEVALNIKAFAEDTPRNRVDL